MPMTFLHPLPTDRSAWIYQTARFSTWFRTIAIDLPGYGRSPTASPGLTVAEVADACWDAVDGTSAEPAILVGLSMGSTVAQFMAAARPQRTLALVLTAGGYFPADDGRFHGNMQAAIAEYRAHGIAAREGQLMRNYGPEFAGTPRERWLTRLFLERNSTADVATMIETYRALDIPVPLDLHAKITAPTLVITGSADPGHAAHRVLASRIRGAELRAMHGAGHMCNVERPWEYDAYVIEFLRERGLLRS
jgi:pimeloyl-ACP methyl ester carboxylesterase